MNSVDICNHNSNKDGKLQEYHGDMRQFKVKESHSETTSFLFDLWGLEHCLCSQSLQIIWSVSSAWKGKREEEFWWNSKSRCSHLGWWPLKLNYISWLSNFQSPYLPPFYLCPQVNTVQWSKPQQCSLSDRKPSTYAHTMEGRRATLDQLLPWL